jgi:sulfane dehydrogenase subunit SoxC
MDTIERARRRFLQEGALLLGALGVAPQVHAETLADVDKYGQRSRFVTSARISDEGANGAFGGQPNVLTPLHDSMGIITPSALHFTSSNGQKTPDIDPKEYRLLIHGMVDRPLVLTLDDLMRLPSVARILMLECQANKTEPHKTTVQLLYGKTSCSEWTGVALSTLLDEVGVQKGATWVVAEGGEAGKLISNVPMGKAMHDCILAYGMNGEPVRPQQGYPVRFLVPGFEAKINIKWLRRLKVTDEAIWHRETRFGHELGPKSVITRPSGGQKLPGAGVYEITGLAWSGAGAIRSVEVSTDGGRNWQPAELKGPVLPVAHTRFGYSWRWNGEEAVIMSRCADEHGQQQPSLVEFAKKNGMTPEETLHNRGGGGHFNVIQPWRIDREGSVHNAIA